MPVFGPIRTGRSEYQAKQFKPCSSTEVPDCARLIHFFFVIRQSGLVSRVVRKIPRELADPCGPRGGSRCTSAPRLVAALIGVVMTDGARSAARGVAHDKTDLVEVRLFSG